jgi:hypothetical protein
MIPVIAIDGPTASGKGTIARQVAAALGFNYLDSGALYRLTALAAQRQRVPLDDEPALARLAAHLDAAFDGERILLDGDDVTDPRRVDGCRRVDPVGVPGGAPGAARAAVRVPAPSGAGRRRQGHGHHGVSRRVAQGVPDRERRVARRAAA